LLQSQAELLFQGEVHERVRCDLFARQQFSDWSPCLTLTTP
jgi:hypothetical protein